MNRAFWDSLTARAGASRDEYQFLERELKHLGWRLEVRGGVLWIAKTRDLEGEELQVQAGSAAQLLERVKASPFQPMARRR